MSGSKEKRRAHGLGREKEDVCGSFSKKLPDTCLHRGEL